LIENAKNHTDKIIICEPVAIRPKDINAHDILGKAVMKITRFFPERIIKILDFLLADNDGINSYSKRANWKQNEQTLKDLYYKMGIKKIYNFIDDYIGVWERNGEIKH
jgi:hypothetical protein